MAKDALACEVAQSVFPWRYFHR